MRYYKVEEELFKRIYNDAQKMCLLRNYNKHGESALDFIDREEDFDPQDLLVGENKKVFLVDGNPDDKLLPTKPTLQREAVCKVLDLLDEHSVPTNDIRAFLRGYLAGSYDGENNK